MRGHRDPFWRVWLGGAALVLVTLLLTACKLDPDMALRKPVGTQALRVTVERIGVFEDDLAYGERRGVYIITDTKTGIEYIGVSGVGVTDVGIHRNGRVQATDER